MEEIRNPFDMSGRVAIITGGATGLGYGMSKALVAFGCRVVMMGRREEVLQKAAGELTGWREFACSYLFGGLMWKMLCGDGYADSYLTSLADAATNLLAGGGEHPGGQWRACPWPARRPIGFSRH